MKSSYHIFLIGLLSISITFLASCQRESPCDTLDCGQYGHCTIDNNGDPVCDCDDGYFGTPCQAIEACSLINCENGGTCQTDDEGNAYCQCPDGFTGENCEEIDHCFEAECVGNTTCNLLSDGTYECICMDGYEDGDEPCDTEMRERFIGTYDILTICLDAPSEFISDVCEISKDPDNIRRITFDKFGHFGTEIYGFVMETNRFAIPLQYSIDNELTKSTFTANITNGQISILYKHESTDGERECQSILTKQ
ncbi:MAG: calcium-binding EGF-like domain-containing protein [Chitinophagales bacterium]